MEEGRPVVTVIAIERVEGGVWVCRQWRGCLQSSTRRTRQGKTRSETENALLLCYIAPMKSATLPAVRIEPELRTELESVLGESESISAFVERAVRDAVNYRKAQAEFLARGETAWQAYQRTGQARPAGEVLDRVQDRIEKRRARLQAKP